MASSRKQLAVGFALLVLLLLLVYPPHDTYVGRFFSWIKVIRSQENLQCFDSDSLDPSVLGYVELRGLEEPLQVEDSCSSDGRYLFEGLCKDNRLYTELVKCNCVEGVCTNATTTTPVNSS